MNRISKNEKYLDDILLSVSKLEESLKLFKSNIKNIDSINKYYGSIEWFKDKEKHDNGSIVIKAGVLSEDAVWNMNEDINDLISEMRYIVSIFDEKKI